MSKGLKRQGGNTKPGLDGRMKGNVFEPEQGSIRANACLFCKSVRLSRASPCASTQEESVRPNAFYMIMELQDGNCFRSQHAFRKESRPGGFSLAQGLSMASKFWSLRTIASNLVRYFVHSFVCTAISIDIISAKRRLSGKVVWSITFWENGIKSLSSCCTCSDQVKEDIIIYI